MTDYFPKLGIQEFTNKVADKVIERGAEKIAGHVVDMIRPMLTQSSTLSSKQTRDKILTRKQTAKVLQVSELTLRKMYREGEVKVYGSGARLMRFKSAELIGSAGSALTQLVPAIK